jgi:hypothetical protein
MTPMPKALLHERSSRSVNGQEEVPFCEVEMENGLLAEWVKRKDGISMMRERRQEHDIISFCVVLRIGSLGPVLCVVRIACMMI